MRRLIVIHFFFIGFFVLFFSVRLLLQFFENCCFPGPKDRAAHNRDGAPPPLEPPPAYAFLSPRTGPFPPNLAFSRGLTLHSADGLLSISRKLTFN